MSVTLDSVSSCSVNASSAPWLIVIGAILVGLGMVSMKQQDAALGLIATGVVLIVSYFGSRSASLVIASNGGERIAIPVQPAQRENYIAFVTALDAAKLALARGR